MQFNTIVVEHSKLSEIQIEDIIRLKKQHWTYPYESQLQWLSDNLQHDDKHIILYDAHKPVAYLNLVNLMIVVDAVEKKAYGVGNVCVDKLIQCTGLGQKIVSISNKIIEDARMLGLLLCHDPLVKFYEKCGWKLYNSESTIISVAGKEYDNHLMSYGGTIAEGSKAITIDRNF